MLLLLGRGGWMMMGGMGGALSGWEVISNVF